MAPITGNTTDQRCTRCILPKQYPGITFNSAGVCSSCENHKSATYLGKTAFKHDIEALLRRFPHRKFDCVIGLSGGRDSTYLLHLLKTVFNLNVLAFFVDHGIIPDHTKKNVINITKKLGVDLAVKKHKNLTNCFSHQFDTWLKNPLPQTVSTLCMGCKYTIVHSFYRIAREYDAPLLMYGWTPFEGARYKMNLMKSNPSGRGVFPYLHGYSKEIMHNWHLISNPSCCTIQLKEFMMFFGPIKKIYNSLFNKIEVKPFEKHIRWVEKEVTDVITHEYGWKNFDEMNSTWRGDCYLGPIRQFLYKSFLGFNDHTPHLSDLIRDGQITRDEALAQLEEKETIPPAVLQKCCEKLNIDYRTLLEVAHATKRKTYKSKAAVSLSEPKPVSSPLQVHRY
jgi:3'-phosphoadenosine 5'-phosphosulfate sulfotransferase (PAPS reductase)/FAD synthetase